MEKIISLTNANKQALKNNSSIELTEKNNSKKNLLKIELYDDIDIEKYLFNVNNELKSQGYSLESRGYIQTIVNILDKLVHPLKFNKTIFFHVLEFAGIDPDSNILLSDFFRSFFQVYGSMKKNKDRISLDIIHRTHKKEVTNNKKLQIQNTETVLENGLTNNSVIKINVLKIIPSLEDYKIINPNEIKLEFGVSKKSKIIDLKDIPSKFIIEINSTQMIEQPLKIFLLQEGNSVFIDRFNIRDLLDTPFIYKFTYNGLSFETKFVWINSKVNYYNYKINSLDEKIDEDKENIIILNNCINHIEDTFKKYLNRNREDKNLTQSSGSTPIEKQIVYSQKIEDYVLTIVGKDVVIMDRIAFFLNKILIVLMVIIFFNRNDILTLVSSVLLLLIELKVIRRIYLNKILILFLISVIFDFVWILFNVANLSYQLPYEESVDRGIRNLGFIFSVASTIIKLFLCFCLWRVTLEYRLEHINKHLLSKFESNKDNIEKSKGKDANIRRTVAKFTNPTHLRIGKDSNPSNLQIPLRILE